MDTPNYLPGGITQEQLDQWKKMYGQVHAVKSQKSDQENTCYLKPPDLKVVKRMMMLFRQNDIIGAGEIAINNLWLGGDNCIRDPKSTAEEMMRAAIALEAFAVLDIPTATSEIIKN